MEATGETKRDRTAAFRRLMRNPQVRRLEACWIADLLAGWAYSLAIVVYTYEVGGADLVGVAMAIKLAPAAIAAPFIATLADRISRRLVLAGAEAVQMTGAALAAFLIMVEGSIVLVIAVGVVITIASTAIRPSVSSLLPGLCKEPEELTAANVANSTIESLAIFAGPAIGGVVLAASSAEALAFGTAGLFGISALLALRVAEPQRSSEGPEESASEESEGGMLTDVAVGFRLVRQDPGLRTVVGLTAAQTLVDGALSVLTVVAALEVLDTGESGIGFLNSAVGVGAALGAFAAARMVGGSLAPSFSIGMFLWGAPLAALVLVPEPGVALLLFGVIGVGNVLIDVAGLTLLQRIAPEDALARVLGVLEAAMLTSIGIGGLLAPVLLNVVGTETAFIVVGLFLPVLAALTWPRVQAIDAASAVSREALDQLRSLPLFASLGPVALEELARKSSPLSVPAGRDVFKQGDPGDRFYVILSGEAEVLVDGRQARVEGPGEYFGEIALLREVPRTATVTASSDLDLLCLEGADFVATVSGNAELTGAADSVIGTRLAHMRPALGTLGLSRGGDLVE